ncbi:MAG: hypothetical protein M3P87_10460 [Actinomycetota bacterium]|nr:hypothetical protein [Actinomycetota bacterium]
MGSRYRTKVLLTTLAMAVVTAMPGIAQAETESTEVETTTTTAAPEVVVPPVTAVTSVLPVLGSGLTVSLTRDATGTITEVALDPSGATIVKEGDHKVVFLLADGDTQVVVKSYSKDKGEEDATAGGVKTTVTADATADVTGPGSWSADVFGTGVVTIPYTVAFDGNVPSITIGDIVLPAGVTAQIGEPKVKTSDEKNKFRISVTLTSGENKAKVAFLASTRLDDDGELDVKLAVTLDSRNHVRCGWDNEDRRSERGDRDRPDDDDQVGATAGFGDRDSRDDDGWDRDREDRRGDRDNDRDNDRDRGEDDGEDRD